MILSPRSISSDPIGTGEQRRSVISPSASPAVGSIARRSDDAARSNTSRRDVVPVAIGTTDFGTPPS